MVQLSRCLVVVYGNRVIISTLASLIGRCGGETPLDRDLSLLRKKKNVEEEKSYYLNKGRVCAARDERRRLKFVLQGRCHYGTGMSRCLVSFFFFFNPPGENLLLS